MKHREYHVFNIGSDEINSVSELVSEVEVVSGHTLDISHSAEHPGIHHVQVKPSVRMMFRPSCYSPAVSFTQPSPPPLLPQPAPSLFSSFHLGTSSSTIVLGAVELYHTGNNTGKTHYQALSQARLRVHAGGA